MDEFPGSESTRQSNLWVSQVSPNGGSLFDRTYFSDLMDGLILLQLEDIVKPGIVDWNRVNRPPYPRIGAMMKKIENCNYAVENGRAMKYSLIGVAGNDIHDQNKTLTLALVWQLMRGYVISISMNSQKKLFRKN